MAGDYPRIFGQCKQTVVDGMQDLLRVAAGQVGPADRSGEEGVSSHQQTVRNEVEADASRGMAWCVDYPGCMIRDTHNHPLVGAGVGGRHVGSFNPKPSCLNIHHLQQDQVALVEQNGGSSRLLELQCASDVVDVGMGYDDLLQRESVLCKAHQNVRNIVAGVDDHGLACLLVADDGAVALQQSDRECLEDHEFIVCDSDEAYKCVVRFKWRR